MTFQERDLQNIFERRAADLHMLSEDTLLATKINAGITNAKLDVLNEAKKEKLGKLSGAWKPAMIESITDGDSMKFVGATGGEGGMDKVTGQKYDLTGKPTGDRIEGFDAYEVPHPGDPYKNSRTGIQKFNEQRDRLSKELGIPVEKVTDKMIYQAGAKEQLIALYNLLPGKKEAWTPGPLDYVDANHPLVLGSKEHPLNIPVERHDVGAYDYFGRPLTNVRNKDTKETVQEGLGYPAEKAFPDQPMDTRDNAGVGSKLLHGLRTFNRTAYDVAISKPAALLEEAITGDKIDEAYRNARLDDMFGISTLDKQLDAEGQAIRDAQRDILYNSKAKTIDRVNAAADVIADSITDTGAWGSSMGTLVGWLSPGALLGKVMKAVRFAAIEAEVLAGTLSKAAANAAKLKVTADLATKTSVLTRAQVGHINAALGEVNQQYKEFVVNNGGKEPEGGKAEFFAKALPVQMINQNLDAFVDMSILKSPAVVVALKDVIVGATNKQMATMAKGIGKTLAAIAAGMASESAQEYVQTMMELFNTRYGSEKFKDKEGFVKFISDPRNYTESSMAALAGAGGSVQFQLTGVPTSVATSIGGNIVDKALGIKEGVVAKPGAGTGAGTGSAGSTPGEQYKADAVKPLPKEDIDELFGKLNLDAEDEDTIAAVNTVSGYDDEKLKKGVRYYKAQLENFDKLKANGEIEEAEYNELVDGAKLDLDILNEVSKLRSKEKTSSPVDIATKAMFSALEKSILDNDENVNIDNVRSYYANKDIGSKNIGKVDAKVASIFDSMFKDIDIDTLDDNTMKAKVDEFIATTGLDHTDVKRAVLIRKIKEAVDEEIKLGSFDRFTNNNATNANDRFATPNDSVSDRFTSEAGTTSSSDTVDRFNTGKPVNTNTEDVVNDRFASSTASATKNMHIDASSETSTSSKTTKAKADPLLDRETSYDNDWVRGISGRTIRKYAKAFGLSDEDVAVALDTAIPEAMIANMKDVSKVANEYQYKLWYDDKVGMMPNYVKYKKAMANMDEETAKAALDQMIKNGYYEDVALAKYKATWDNIEARVNELREAFKEDGEELTNEDLIGYINSDIKDGALSNEVPNSSHKIDVREVVTGVVGKSSKVLNAIESNVNQIKGILGDKFKAAKGRVESISEEYNRATNTKAELVKLQAALEAELADKKAKGLKTIAVEAKLKRVKTDIANRSEQTDRTEGKFGNRFIEEKYEQAYKLDDEMGLGVVEITRKKAKELKSKGVDTSKATVVAKSKIVSDDKLKAKVEMLKNAQKLRVEAKGKGKLKSEQLDNRKEKIINRLNKLRESVTKNFKDNKTVNILAAEFNRWEDTYYILSKSVNDIQEKKNVKDKELKVARAKKQRLVDMLNKANDKIGDDVLTVESTPTEISSLAHKILTNTNNSIKLVVISLKQLAIAYEVDKLQAEVDKLAKDLLVAKNTKDAQTSTDSFSFKEGLIKDNAEMLVGAANKASIQLDNLIRLSNLRNKAKNVDYVTKLDKALARAKEAVMNKQTITKAMGKSKTINETIGSTYKRKVKVSPTLVNSLSKENVMRLVPEEIKGYIDSVYVGAKDHLGKAIANIMEQKSPDYKLKDNPALEFVVDKNGKVIEEMAGIIGLVTEEFVGTNIAGVIRNSDDEIKRIRSIHPNMGLSALERSVFRSGKYAKLMAAQLGQGIMQAAGLSADKMNISPAEYEKLKTGFGQLGLFIAQQKGQIKDVYNSANGISAATMNKVNEVSVSDQELESDGEGSNQYIAMVKANVNDRDKVSVEKFKAGMKTISENMKLFNESLDIDGFKKTYRTTKRKVKGKFGVRDSQLDAPQTNEDVLEKLVNEEHVVQKEAVDMLTELVKTDAGKVAVLKSMKWEDLDKLKEKGTTRENYETKEAANQEIEKEMDELLEMVDLLERGVIDNSIYYDWFFAKNGRYNIDSITVNGQAGKHLHRWLVVNKANYREWDLDNKTDKMFFDQGIAQAFGQDIDKVNPDKISKISDAIRELSKEELLSIVTSKDQKLIVIVDNKSVTLKIGHIGHVLQAIQAIEAARTSKKINVPMLAEYDEATSGFALKLFELPLLGIDKLKDWSLKTGMIISDIGSDGSITTIGSDGKEIILKTRDDNGNPLSVPEIIEQEGFLDAYRTLAVGVNNKVKDIKELDIPTKKGKENVHAKAKEIFKVINSTEGVLEPIADDKGVVTSFGRNLFKYPFMMFNYGASLKKLQLFVGYQVAEALVNKIAAGELEGKKFAKVRIAIAGTEAKWKAMRAELIDGEKYAEEIKIDGVSLMEAINVAYSESYGKQFVETMKDNFGEILEANKTMVQASQMMFRVFDKVYKQEFIKLSNSLNEGVPAHQFDTYEEYAAFVGKKNNKGDFTNKDKLVTPTIDQIEKMEDGMKEMFPAIKGPNSESTRDGILFMDSEVIDMKDSPLSKVSTTKADGKQATLHSMLRVYKETVAAGAVLPTHWKDGGSIGRALIMGGILGIHDAIVLGHNIEKALEAVNKGIYEVSRDYNTVGAFLEALTNIVEIAEKDYDIDVAYIKSVGFENKNTGEMPLNIFEVLYKLNELNNRVVEARTELFTSGKYDISVGNMVGPVGAYEVKANTNVDFGIINDKIAELIKGCK